MCAAPQSSCACIRECRGEHFSRDNDDLNESGVNKDQVFACAPTQTTFLMKIDLHTGVPRNIEVVSRRRIKSGLAIPKTQEDIATPSSTNKRGVSKIQ